MCGIVGIITRDKERNLTSHCHHMMDLIKHRGPDAIGFYINKKEGVYIGHRRLSIIDLSPNATQPFYNEKKNICCVCNGEIYNFKELRSILEQRGHKFVSNSDSEVIVHGYEEWGIEYIERLNGMFTFVIWDAEKKNLILARDRIGIKPLYYINKKDYFAFASEAKAFMGLKEMWSPEIDRESLNLLIGFQFIPNDNTLLKDVKKILPGCFLIVEGGSIRMKRYWKLRKNEILKKIEFSEAIERLEELLLDSVRLRLQADVRVGILLSGGLDSSLISALAKKVSSSGIYTYTVGYNHPWDERKFALITSKHINSIHHSIQIDPFEVNNRIEELIWHFDDLSTLDGGIFSTYLISKKIKEFGVKVLLVGEGGDEVFGGYSWFGLSQLPFKLLPKYLRNIFYYYATNRLLFNRKAYDNFFYFNKIMDKIREKDVMRQVGFFEIVYQLPNSYLMKVDKATMANSLEARVPYLDHRVVEFSYSLPWQYKLQGHWFNMKKVNEKIIIRAIAQKYLPTEIAMRKKRGFSLPIPQVLKSNIDKIKDYLLSRGSLALSLFSRKKIERLFDFKTCLYVPIEKEKEVLLWKLYLLEVWNNVYVKKKVRS